MFIFIGLFHVSTIKRKENQQTSPLPIAAIPTIEISNLAMGVARRPPSTINACDDASDDSRPAWRKVKPTGVAGLWSPDTVGKIGAVASMMRGTNSTRTVHYNSCLPLNSLLLILPTSKNARWNYDDRLAWSIQPQTLSRIRKKGFIRSTWARTRRDEEK